MWLLLWLISLVKHLSRVILFNETVITVKSMMLWFEHWPGHQKVRCLVNSVAVAVVSLGKEFHFYHQAVK